MVFYLKNYGFLVTCRYCYASKSPKYVKMIVQTGTYHVQWAFEEKKEVAKGPTWLRICSVDFVI